MTKKLYVGNLSFQTTADELKATFAEFGDVTSSSVITDRDTGRSRGFGFIEMSQGAEEAIEALNGADVGGRRLTVNEARPRESSSRSGGGDRGRSW